MVSLVAAIGGFLFGFDSGVINGTVDALANTFNASDIGTGFSVASILLGCAIGALFAGTLADHFGRRPLMLVTAIVFIISAWGSGIAASATEFVLYRFIGGLSVGAASVLAPAYISEIAPAAIRGRLASLQQLAIVIGLFSAFLSNYFLAEIAGGATQPLWRDIPAWRWMYWMEIVPAILYFIGALLIPESPRYLVGRGQEHRARVVFMRLGVDGAEALVLQVKESLGEIRKAKLSDLFEAGSSRRIHPILWVGIGLSVFQQLVGINVVFYYGEVLWKSAGFGEGQALLVNVITGFTNIAATFVAIAVIDTFGRRPLLLLGSAGMAISLTVLAVLFATGGVGPDGKLVLSVTTGRFALVAANVYVVFFAISWGPVVWVLLGEMFDNRIRGTALAVAASAQWVANFAVTMTFPIMLGRIGLGGSYSTYAAAAAISFFFVWKFVRETKGQELEHLNRAAARAS
jgi:SP family sugar:H+ symporter-like MFS transporter